MKGFLLVFSILCLQGKDSLPPRKGTEVPVDLARAVDAAVDRGVGWLREQQGRDGSFRFVALRQGAFGDYPLGLTALSTLALLSCGVPREDRAIEKATRYILGHPSQSTYEAALVLMALDMKGAPPWERKLLDALAPPKRPRYTFPRVLAAEERRRMEEDAKKLLQGWKGNEIGYWSYGLRSVADGDISNTQFAVLGLKAASRCGVEVPEAAFLQILELFLGSQAPNGPAVRTLHRFDGPEPGDGYLLEVPAQARGWGYFLGREFGNESDVTGSRTNIGLGCIALCRDELLRRGSPETAARLRRLELKIQIALRDGLAWLDQVFSVERNPGTESFGRRALMPVNGFWYYYYMYSLERIGSLIPTRYVGRHDWYQEGAEALLKRQKKDGSWMEWHPVVDTAFALLFLRRATIPSVFTATR